MTLSERILEYRAKYGISQRKMDLILGENNGTVFRIESEKRKTRKANALRISKKLDELEKK